MYVGYVFVLYVYFTMKNEIYIFLFLFFVNNKNNSCISTIVPFNCNFTKN